MTAPQAAGTPATGASPGAAPASSRDRARTGVRVRDYGILVALVAIVAALTFGTDTFATRQNLVNLFDQVSVVGLLAIGATVCILSGVFDLTASATLALSAITGVTVGQHLGTLPGFVAAVVAGALLGLLTGTIVVRSGVNSFIGTLATSIIYRGAAVVVTAGAIAYPLESQAEQLGMLTWPSLFGLTSATTIFVVVALAATVLVSSTTFGRRLYAVGGNAEAARLSGIRTENVQVAAYVVSGACSALAGLILASRAGSAQSSMATGMELTAIAAAVIGGTSILGGEGAVWRGVVGALLLTLIGNGFNLLGWDTTFQQVTTGVLILLAVAVDAMLRRRSR